MSNQSPFCKSAPLVISRAFAVVFSRMRVRHDMIISDHSWQKEYGLTRSNMGHTHLSSLEQSCQGGATCYKKTKKTYHQQQSGHLKTKAPYLFLNRLLKGWQKYAQRLKNTVTNAKIGDISVRLNCWQ